MTQQEAFEIGWRAARSARIEPVEVWEKGVKKIHHHIVNPDRPLEIEGDETLLAAWWRGYDEGHDFSYDMAYPPPDMG